MGIDVVFAGQPRLFTAAHEAAHVIQQRLGLQLPNATGQAGDRHERHADLVAAEVVTGRSVEPLLDSYAHHPGNNAGHPALQMDGGNENEEPVVLDNGIVTEDTSVPLRGRRRTLRQGTYVEVIGRDGDVLHVRAYSGHDGRLADIPSSRFLHQPQITNDEEGAPRDDIGFARIEGSLFGPGGLPQPGDVDQGEIGDCYLMSAMYGVAASDPRSLLRIVGHETFVLGDVYFMGPRYEVTFFRDARGRRARPIIVDNYFPVHSRRGRISGDLAYAGDQADTLEQAQSRPLWPLVIEKAYAQYRNGYPLIDDGRSPDSRRSLSALATPQSATMHALIALTGRASQANFDPMVYNQVAELSLSGTRLPRSAGEHLRMPPDEMLRLFESYLAEGVAVVLGTPQVPVVGDDELLVDDSRGAPRIVTEHAYGLESVDRSARLIQLFNPWNEDVDHRGPSVHPPPLTPEQVQRYFNQVIFTRPPGTE